MLEITNLNKSFGRFKALNNLSLTVNEGELFGFVGSNGAGKTTTMKICTGLLKADSGSVKIAGEELLDSRRDKLSSSKVGYVPDFFGVYENLTAIEYLQFYAGCYNIWGKANLDLCESLLELVNLTDKRNSQVDGLSRGMKQRLCLARSLVSNPQLLFLDEPASGLDPKARHELKEILRNLVNMGRTIVISSHILPELIEMCSSIGIISHGEMKFNGSIEDALKFSKGGIKNELILKDRIDDALRIVREFPTVSSTEVNDNSILFTSDGEDETSINILKKLVLADIPVIGLQKRTENIEDIFLDLMEGGTDK